MITAFTISTFCGLPLCTRLFEGLFAKWNGGTVKVFHCHVQGLTQYSAAVKIQPLVFFSTYDLFRKQSWIVKLKKYLHLPVTMFMTARRDKRPVFYVIDLYSLAWAIALKKWWWGDRLKILYHQFEMEDPRVLDRQNRFFFSYMAKNARYIDLCILPEINRLLFFRQYVNIDDSKCLVFPNTTAPVANLSPGNRANDKIIFAHIGSMGEDHYGLHFIEAFKSVSQEAEFWVIGRVVPEIETFIKKQAIPNIRFIGPVPHAALEDYYKQIDYGLILYQPTSLNSRYCAPNKLYEMWASGIAVLAPDTEGLQPVFTHHDLGTLVDMENAAALKNTLQALIKTKRTREDRNRIVKIFEEQFAIHHHLQILTDTMQKNAIIA